MIRVLPNVLNAAELQAVRELLRQVRFGDGRITNPDSTVKHNLQAPQDDDANARIAQIARDALVRNPDLRTYARPRTMARATVVRYEPGMDYGWHVDEALFPSTPPIRSDLSCTIFLNSPKDYDGGELAIELGAQELSYKLEPGSAILYPSTTIYRVTPVTRGVRLAAITWLHAGSPTPRSANCWCNSTKPAHWPAATRPAMPGFGCCWSRAHQPVPDVGGYLNPAGSVSGR